MDEIYPNALAPGTRIGAVVLERAIGQGAWGIVYEGRHDLYGHVAVKEYFPSTYASRQTRGSVGSSAPQWQEAVRRGLERFGNEGRALRTIRHENVVAVHDYIEQGDVALLVMEFVEGVTLNEALAAGRFAQPAEVMALGATLVDTLQALHAKNVLHRDIAPDNVMIRKDDSPVLIDFGGAGAAIASATRSSQNIVKDGYSPPEQYDTSATPSFPVGPWSDIYATSAVLYRVATGREPAVANARLLAAGMKNGQDPLQPIAANAPPNYPAHWLAGVDAGLALLPKDRPQSASDWRKRFEAPIKHPGPNKLLVGVAAGSSLIAAALAAYAIVPKFVSRPDPVPLVSPIASQITPKPRPKNTAAPHAGAKTAHVAGQGQQRAYTQQQAYAQPQKNRLPTTPVHRCQATKRRRRSSTMPLPVVPNVSIILIIRNAPGAKRRSQALPHGTEATFGGRLH
jgi:serine/threonine protein kinase